VNSSLNGDRFGATPKVISNGEKYRIMSPDNPYYISLRIQAG